MPTSSDSRGFWGAFALLAALAVLPLWTGEFPPLDDLPQHAAQISVLRHWSEPACGYAELYEIRWADPYWLGYALAWALSWLVSVPTALRLVLSAVVIAIPLACLRPVRALGGDPWWVLLCLPLAYGFPMSAGFFPYYVSVPLVLLLLGAGVRYARAPALGRGLLLGAGCAALFLVHVFALALAGLLLATMVVAGAPALRAIPRRLAPLLAAVPAPIAWLLLAPADDRSQRDFPSYAWTSDRILELPVLVTGIPGRWMAFAALALVLGSVAWTRPTLARDPVRWVPFGVILLLVAAGPVAYYIAPRYAVFLFPALLCALDRAAPALRSPGRYVQVAGVAFALLGVVLLRFAAMSEEGRGLAPVLAAAPAGARLLYLPYDRQSPYSHDLPFLHSGMLYAVNRCGVAEESFARSFQLPVRFRPGRASPLPAMFGYMPYRFRWEKHDGAGYDLFLIRAAAEPDIVRIAGAEGRLALLSHAGPWWLYENVAARPLTSSPDSAVPPSIP